MAAMRPAPSALGGLQLLFAYRQAQPLPPPLHDDSPLAQARYSNKMSW